jgi:hypothetical protein
MGSWSANFSGMTHCVSSSLGGGGGSAVIQPAYCLDLPVVFRERIDHGTSQGSLKDSLVVGRVVLEDSRCHNPGVGGGTESLGNALWHFTVPARSDEEIEASFVPYLLPRWRSYPCAHRQSDPHVAYKRTR